MRASVRQHTLVSTFICLLATSYSSQADELPDQFDAIKEFLVSTVSDAQSVGAATTYSLLQENLAAFRVLKQRVDAAPRVDDMIDDLALELDVIATNFERAANLRVEYAHHTSQNQYALADRRAQTRSAISQLQQKVATTQLELDHARSGVISDPQRQQVIIGANTSVINSLQAQIEIWNNFEHSQERLARSLNLSTEKVDFLLFVLEKNAQVYREAANAAKLRQSVRMALDNLQSMGAIEGTLAELAASWREVDQIVGEIGRTELIYAGS